LAAWSKYSISCCNFAPGSALRETAAVTAFFQRPRNFEKIDNHHGLVEARR
jgi:hypothetical protein